MESEITQAHLPCEDCDSSDALAVYDDGHTHCFSCGAHKGGTSGDKAGPAKKPALPAGLVDYAVGPLPSRRISKDTASKYSYGFGTLHGKPCHVANYYDATGSRIVAQKLRFENKSFTIRGDAKAMPLYGQWLCRDGGKIIVVTEGEIDALTVSQIQDNRWPVVSIPQGAQGAAKAVRKSLEFLEGYERVVFMFDMDDAGRKAAEECAMILSPGKARIASLPMKDPNECLLAGKPKVVVDALWGAKTYRPDGILDSDEALQLLRSRKLSIPIATYPYPELESMTRGIIPRQLVVICAGSGMGKTEFTRELAYSFLSQGVSRIGYVALEESVDRTAVGLVGCALNQRLYLHDNPESCDGFHEAWGRLITNRVWFYDHFGSLQGDTLTAKLRYLRVACDVDVIILDHLSIIVSGMEDGDERRTIDNIMTRLRSLSEETGVCIVAISHLKRPQGTSHEEGGRTSLAQLRGSAAIGQLADIVIGLERDQQDEQRRNYTRLRVLKNRRTGETGPAGWAYYDKDTGRMVHSDGPSTVATGVASYDRPAF